MINLTTGPVALLPQVIDALALPSISHRSPAFFKLHQHLTQTFCERLKVKQTFILTGSGTLANEVMIAQIYLRNQPGLIVANGEFGERLINQAHRYGIKFQELRKNWGEALDYTTIEIMLKQGQIKWMLFCHCESSTGIINPLASIVNLCKKYDCSVYVDCMSTLGTVALDLSTVAMATASSGKAIGSVAGLGLVFTNIKTIKSNLLPVYFDLDYFQTTNGIPFTISSNLLAALHEAVIHNLMPAKWQSLDLLSTKIYEHLHPLSIIPFATHQSRIFTLVPKNINSELLGEMLLRKGVQLSYQSNYLIKRNWLELAIFGSYQKGEIDHALEVILRCLQKAGKHNTLALTNN